MVTNLKHKIFLCFTQNDIFSHIHSVQAQKNML